MGLNKAQLIGNLGAEVELRYTKSGAAVANLRIATNERKKVGDDWVEHTEWHRVTVFGRQAENCEKFLSKGRQVYIEGRLQTRDWEDKDGNKRYTTEIVAQNVQFLSGGDGNSSKSSNGSTPDADHGQSFNDDDIPF